MLQIERVVPVEKQGERGAGVGLTHQGFADKEGAVSHGLEAGDVLGCADAALRDVERGGGQVGGEFEQRVSANRLASQVAAVDPDEIEAEVSSALNLVAIVGLAENIKAKRDGFGVKIAESVVGVGGDDEEDGVGAGSAGFEHLERVEDKVLADAGNVDGGGGSFKVMDRAEEEHLVREDREGSRPCKLKCDGKLRGMEVASNEPFGRRRLLDLRNDRRTVRGGRTQGADEAAGRMSSGLALQLVIVGRELARVDVEQSPGENLVELSGHVLLLYRLSLLGCEKAVPLRYFVESKCVISVPAKCE